MRSIIDWLRDLIGSSEQPSQRPEAAMPPAQPAAALSDVPPAHQASLDSREQALGYLDKVRTKLDRLAQDFNAGTINRSQFQSLYSHYQREMRNIETLIEAVPTAEGWRGAATEGQSVIIRRKHVARAEGYAIFENESGMPVSTLGNFKLDPALLVPMLSSYRAATREIFGAGTRSTEIEDGRWLCYVPGEFTTMLAVFSTEPARKQLDFLDELHRHFENANRSQLSGPILDRSRLMFPHEYFLGQWRR